MDRPWKTEDRQPWPGRRCPLLRQFTGSLLISTQPLDLRVVGRVELFDWEPTSG